MKSCVKKIKLSNLGSKITGDLKYNCSLIVGKD